jgi:hypothetical protein
MKTINLSIFIFILFMDIFILSKKFSYINYYLLHFAIIVNFWDYLIKFRHFFYFFIIFIHTKYHHLFHHIYFLVLHNKGNRAIQFVKILMNVCINCKCYFVHNTDRYLSLYMYSIMLFKGNMCIVNIISLMNIYSLFILIFAFFFLYCYFFYLLIFFYLIIINKLFYFILFYYILLC